MGVSKVIKRADIMRIVNGRRNQPGRILINLEFWFRFGKIKIFNS